MGALAATSLPPTLTLLDGGLDEVEAERLHRLAVENAWVEAQAVAHEAQVFADTALTAARRIQVAIAQGLLRGRVSDIERAGQIAHELELAAPLHAYRARRSELEAQSALADLTPTRPEPVA